MCHPALASGREELAWAARRGRLASETIKGRRPAECTSASLLGLVEAPGKQQFELLKAAKSLPIRLAAFLGCVSALRAQEASRRKSNAFRLTVHPEALTVLII
jgi:hypothetical protein